MSYTRSYKGAGVAPRPGGGTAYADPGYQADKKPRYPIDSEEHVRAAWAHLNVPENQAKYGHNELHHVRAAVQSGMRKHNVDPYVEAGRKIMEG